MALLRGEGNMKRWDLVEMSKVTAAMALKDRVILSSLSHFFLPAMQR